MASAGDARAAAALVPRMVAVAHLLGENLPVRVGLLQAALDSLDGVASADRERARLGSAMAAAYLVDDRLDEAIAYGDSSRAESQRLGDEEAALNTAATLGSVLVFAGRMEEGWRLLEDAIVRATGGEQEAEAARGYRMIGSSASALVEYDLAEHWLPEGIGYAEKVELWNHRHYMASHLAHVQWATGQWQAAARTAQQALADGRGGLTTQITAQFVLGYLALGRGDWTVAAGLLGEAFGHGDRMAELQRLSPPLWGLAEAARCQGDYDTALRHCERGYQASADVTDASYLYPYLLTGVRAHLARGDVDAAQAWSTRSARCSPSAPSRAPCLRSATPGDCSCSPGARWPRRIRNCRRPASRGRSCGGSGKARGPGSTSRRRPPGRAAAARQPCSPTRSAPSPPRPAPPFSPRPPIGSADHLTRPSRPSRGIR